MNKIELNSLDLSSLDLKIFTEQNASDYCLLNDINSNIKIKFF